MGGTRVDGRLKPTMKLSVCDKNYERNSDKSSKIHLTTKLGCCVNLHRITVLFLMWLEQEEVMTTSSDEWQLQLRKLQLNTLENPKKNNYF